MRMPLESCPLLALRVWSGPRWHGTFVRLASENEGSPMFVRKVHTKRRLDGESMKLHSPSPARAGCPTRLQENDVIPLWNRAGELRETMSFAAATEDTYWMWRISQPCYEPSSLQLSPLACERAVHGAQRTRTDTGYTRLTPLNAFDGASMNHGLIALGVNPVKSYTIFIRKTRKTTSVNSPASNPLSQ